VKTLSTTRELILDAARVKLVSDGYAALSTRKVAEGAEVHLSQLHYHFGGKQQLLLGVLERESARLLERQAQMYGQERPLAERYEQACDFLDEDLASGYVRLLQEMTAAGWSDAAIASVVRVMAQRWVNLLTSVIRDAEQQGMSLGPFTATQAGTLLALLFLGGESALLLGLESNQAPIREALRRVAGLIQQTDTGE
jgi:AcrR family transcriptional regulator